MINKIGLLIIVSCILIGCIQSSNNLDLAGSTLVRYFDLLSRGEYQQASKLYGGNYDMLIQMNPDVNPRDFEGLWKNACTVNGFHCLQIKRVDHIESDGRIVILYVEFMNPDGSLFVQSPCCGDIQSPEIRISLFKYQVQIDETRTGRVLDLPVYIP